MQTTAVAQLKTDKGGRRRSGVLALPSISLDSVSVATHDLTVQSKMLSSLTKRIGVRLNYWLRRTAKQTSDAGLPEHEAPIPSPEFLEAFRYYQAALLGLLKEQRERAKLQGDAPTEEQLQAQFATELRRALETFTPEERQFAMKLWSEGPKETK